jgi:hypothetical protein
MGMPPSLFGVSRFFRFLISDKQAFRQSMAKLLKWDFEHIVVAHRDPVMANARDVVREALRESTREGGRVT